MANSDVDGWDELRARLTTLPERLQRRVLNGWATAQANRMAAMLRPAVQAVAWRTGRLTGSIRGKAVRSKRAMTRFGVIARAIAFSSKKHGGYAFNPINSGTAARYTKGKNGKKVAFRGRVTPRRIIVGTAPIIHQSIMLTAQNDLANRIERALRKNAGG